MATVASNSQLPESLRRKWYLECSSPSRKEAPDFDKTSDALRIYVWKMWQETRLHADLLRERGIPISVSEWAIWGSCISNPFKCAVCMANGADFDMNCCPADDYRWIRDNYYIDEEDYRRMLRNCPQLSLTPEPLEWQDGAPATNNTVAWDALRSAVDSAAARLPL